MRNWIPFVACALGGLLLGTGFAAWSVHQGSLGATVSIGPWRTGADFGSAEASSYTRAVVAWRGLLAAPAREVRYYTAADDDSGRPLDGHCRYRVSGGDVGGSWWSLALYDSLGYLVANPYGLYSVESAAMSAMERAHWSLLAAPERQPGRWLPTGSVPRFELTLRIYQPSDGGAGNLPLQHLPRIERLGC